MLYQAVTGKKEEHYIFRQFSPDFFDLIVVDECHQGSAKGYCQSRCISICCNFSVI
ncbi:DEAD/DEAH box helicase family protein [Endozoicomonas sp. ISHI1]|uniref:DEAD/DEAH box helicase family protein n=1 Tax=Endozoicomonas sp. ISHI1 TaxID=2825882 RepID=UPI0035A09468